MATEDRAMVLRTRYLLDSLAMLLLALMLSGAQERGPVGMLVALLLFALGLHSLVSWWRSRISLRDGVLEIRSATGPMRLLRWPLAGGSLLLLGRTLFLRRDEDCVVAVDVVAYRRKDLERLVAATRCNRSVDERDDPCHEI